MFPQVAMNEDPWSTATCQVTKTVLQTGVTRCSTCCCLSLVMCCSGFQLIISAVLCGSIHFNSLCSFTFHKCPCFNIIQSFVLGGKASKPLACHRVPSVHVLYKRNKSALFQLRSGCFYIVFSHFNLNAFLLNGAVDLACFFLC